MKKNLHILANSQLYPNKFVPDYARFLSDNVRCSVNDFLVIGEDYNLGTGFKYKVVNSSIYSMLRAALESKNYEKIIFHSIPSRFCLVFLLFKMLTFSRVKFFVILWGGEIHFLKNNGFRDKLNVKLDNLFLRLMDGFITYIKQDFDLAVKLSGNKNAVWIDIQSVYPSNTVQIESELEKKENLKVLIGTSALKGNRHIEIIDKISMISFDDSTEFIIPLSYGSKSYAEEVSIYARKKLRGSVRTLLEFMPISEYNQLLSEIHIALFMHDGQQGMGNIRNLLAYGCKVFMNKESISYKYCAEAGFKVYDIHTLKKLTYNDNMSENRKLARALFSRDILAKQTISFLSGNY